MTAKKITPKRAAIYVRVSSEEQVDGYSLDAQLRAIESYCDQHDIKIAERYRDEGKSARTRDLKKRPAFARMIEDAKLGRFDLIVVHKLDRFARNLGALLDVFDKELSPVGVGLVSLAEQMDFTTPMGRLSLQLMGGIAEFYSGNLSFETKKGKRERKLQGLYNGLVPFGMTRGSSDGKTPPVADPKTFDGLMLAFQLAASGKTDREIARALNAAGYRTTGNRGANPFSKDTVRAMLQNRFYLGELPDGESGWLPGKHAPVVDPELFAQAEAARLRNRTRPRRVKTEARSPWALSGLAVCVCGATMTAYGHAGGKQRVQCSRRTQTKECDAPTFYAEIVEQQIGDFLKGFAVPEDKRQHLVAAWKRRNARQVDRDAERHRFNQKLDRLRVLYVEGDLDESAYRLKRAEITEQLAALPSETGLSEPRVGEQLAAYLADVSVAWQAATPEERNKLARQLFNKVEIQNRTAVEVTPRPDLLPFFAELASESSSVMTYGRKRRGSVCHTRYGFGYLELPASFRDIVSKSFSLSNLDQSSALRLSSVDTAQVRALSAKGRTLREIAELVGVSHETIRKALKAAP